MNPVHTFSRLNFFLHFLPLFPRLRYWRVFEIQIGLIRSTLSFMFGTQIYITLNHNVPHTIKLAESGLSMATTHWRNLPQTQREERQDSSEWLIHHRRSGSYLSIPSGETLVLIVCRSRWIVCKMGSFCFYVHACKFFSFLPGFMRVIGFYVWFWLKSGSVPSFV